ncbi:MAG TPA: glycine dehydrogenase (aminomethyl-transferring), partial [Burkholderiaceae bacterium]|nr:glycine dehydrogenase (aminomethyl-transferring) [Burkholderiaceae bacterium]
MSTLSELEAHNDFHSRHIGPNDSEIAEMLAVVGAASLDELVDAIVPATIKLNDRLALPAAFNEEEALARIRAIAAKNEVVRSFIGQGYHGTHTPKVILRNVLENPAWYTAYTPYQAEISQGRLEALINFQTMVSDLTGMAIANSSLLDEATAAAEAMTLAKRSARAKSNVLLVAGDCHPQTIEVVKTRAEPLGIDVKVGFVPELMKGGDYFGVLAQYPSTTGLIHDMRTLVGHAHAAGALFCVATDLLALTLLEAPGAWDADIVVGTSQRFGVPFGFGGPHAAFLACKD